MSEGEVAGFRVSFRQDGEWVEAPGFRKVVLPEDVTPPDALGRRVPGARKYSNITLKRGITSRSGSLAAWEKDPDGRYVRKDLRIELVNDQGAPIAVYAFKQGWPTKWHGSPFNAGANETAVEELTLDYEDVRIE